MHGYISFVTSMANKKLMMERRYHFLLNNFEKKKDNCNNGRMDGKEIWDEEDDAIVAK